MADEATGHMRASVKTNAKGQHQPEWSVVLPIPLRRNTPSTGTEYTLDEIRTELLRQEAEIEKAMTAKYPQVEV